MLKNASIRQLRIFEVAATTLSFSRAAEQSFITQPAVSMQIKLFEDEFGTALFQRMGKKLLLTEAGRELLRHARILLGQLKQAEAFARHPHCLVAATDQPLAGERNIPWAALRDEPFIFREVGSATRQFLEHLMQSESLQVNVTMELSGNETIKQAVMSGMGISFLSAHCFQVELDAGRLAVLDVEGLPKMIDWYLLHRRERTLAGISAAFRDFLLGEGRELVLCRFSAQDR